MFGHRFGSHAHARSGWFHNKWFRRGLFLLVLPVGAVACHGRGHHHGTMTEAEMKERANDHVDDAMDWLDATEAQTQQVQRVVETAIPDVVSYRDEHRALRSEFQKELAADTVDAAALEDLRQRFVKLADAATARGLRVVTDIAQVLTPQQRKKAVEKWQKFSR